MIGNGDKVSIYNSNWLPRPQMFKPFSPHVLPMDTKVKFFIKEDNSWDVEKIRQFFLEDDVNKILSIKLPRTIQEDKYAWHFDRRGMYSVRSGYKVALQTKYQDVPSCSGNPTNEWKYIWSLNLPAKVKIFIWRALSNLLPTVGRLYKKNVLESPICQRCSNAAENVYHALIGCNQARKVWKLAGFVHLVRQVHNEDIWDVFQNAMLSVSKAEFELLAASMWTIWHARNEFHFSKSISDPSSILAKVEAMCSSYQMISFQEETAAGSRSEPTVTGWKPPLEKWFKLNVDAATNAGEGRAGLGAIVRNWK
ncbi:zf-RVT domain-containing protein [Citrus sinensis]|nr:zf-RVT domain-containing protein [Citrus sinensis]